MKDKKIGFIGGGFMGEALMNGLLASRFCQAEQITVSDIHEDRLKNLGTKYGVNVCAENAKTAAGSDILILAIKPQMFSDILEDIASSIGEGTLVISIAAGVKVSAIATFVKAKIVRAMPNMCAQVGQAVTAICGNLAVTDEDYALVERLFNSVGKTVRVSEKHMNAVTALSGSGPAYIFLVMEAMIDAGVENGLTHKQSRILVEQTVRGAAELALKTGAHPAELKARIMSPQGTTVAALHVFEEAGVRGTFLNAVSAAFKRSVELGG